MRAKGRHDIRSGQGALSKLDIQIIYEDENFLAVNKPAGILTHPTASSKDEKTIVDWILENRPEVKGVGDDFKTRPGIAHRLDKDTSGIILIPKNQKYFDYLKNLFQTRQIKKTYLALVFGTVQPKEGIIDKPIGLKSGSVKRTVFTRNAKMVKPAQTEYKVKEYLVSRKGGGIEQAYSLLEVAPKTGRTHQIRVHLASIGHPIVGDVLYGRKNDPLHINRQFLHAESLEFALTDGKRVKLSVELPDDLQEVVKELIPND